MSAEKRRKTVTPEEVPGLGDPDRKRVLNVLAQRRYRQKRKEKMAELEAKTKSLTPSPANVNMQSGSDRSSTSSSPEDQSGNTSSVEVVQNQNLVSVDFRSLDFNAEAMDLSLFTDFGLSTYLPQPDLSPTAPFAAAPQPLFPTPTISTPSPLPDTQLATGAFPLFNTIKCFTLIADALNIVPHMENPSYLHVLPATDYSHLPPNIRPLPCQLTIPHHPILDILPWPSAREKLIYMFALPSRLRPPVAQEEVDEETGQSSAVIRILQDLDDTQGPVRNHGNAAGWGQGNEFVEEAWELGEKFYRDWWWCVDRGVVERSNRLRRERGEGGLRAGK